LDGEEAEGRAYLEKVRDHLPDHAVSKNNVPDDYLSGKADAEALAAVYQEVDEKRSSLLNKKDSLEKTLKKYPEFKAAWFALASTYLQLHRTKEAYSALKSLHALSDQDATVEYYLAVLSAEREAFPDAWRHLKNAEALAAKRGHKAKPLIELRRQLSIQFPDPLLK
jgi:predicted Zn-dependent protease